MTPPTQVRVFGRYRLHRQLGQGGMGTVYLAHDTALNRWVALKVPDLTSRNRTKVLERFRREARVAASIEHPNVCPILDIGEIHGAAYLTMPFIRGTSLDQRLDSDHPWPPGDAAVLITKLAGALGAMHARKLIHRDLKPGNVLIREDAEPVLVDFGLARSFSDPAQRLTRMGQRLGTPAYMSPEQVKGAADQGPATDIYALGVIFYELLTGHVPFEGGPVELVWAWILNAEPRHPSEMCPALSAGEDALVLRALAKDPTQRYASMEEFAQALHHYIQRGWSLPLGSHSGRYCRSASRLRSKPAHRSNSLGFRVALVA